MTMNAVATQPMRARGTDGKVASICGMANETNAESATYRKALAAAMHTAAQARARPASPDGARSRSSTVVTVIDGGSGASRRV